MRSLMHAFPAPPLVHGLSTRLGALGLIALLFGTSPDAKAQATNAEPAVTVKMVARSAGVWRFEPEAITVRPGDLIRFVQEDTAPHNVEFKEVPKGTNLGEARMGTFLLQKGETYDLVIDDRFAPGKHVYVCTPHEALGMKGTLTVLEATPANPAN